MTTRFVEKTCIASFDIGKKNFSFCVEEFSPEHLMSIHNIPLTKRYNSDGTPTTEMETVLEEVFTHGKIILHRNVNLTVGCDPSKKLDPLTFHNMIEVLDKYTPYWDKCSAFVIEEQMSFGKKLNKMAMKLGQHCYSYFCFKYGLNKQIIEFPAYHKTQVLGAPKTRGKKTKKGGYRWKAMSKPERKKWAANRAAKIFRDRGDVEMLTQIKNASKKDDLADTFLQLKSFQYLVYVNKQL